MGRPRDIIAFVSRARKFALESGHQVIERDDIYEAEVDYSRHLLNELEDEHKQRLPHLGSGIAALKRIGVRRFTVDEWAHAAQQEGLSRKQAEEILKAFYDSAVLGTLQQGGKNAGSAIRFSYTDRHLKPPVEGAMQVHPGLIKELGLREERNMRSSSSKSES